MRRSMLADVVRTVAYFMCLIAMVIVIGGVCWAVIFWVMQVSGAD